ncbi:hypothetical protein BDV96DRAFT_487682 [Lophiotrema nucula]|uniref:Uncharacterized protein n=1 Tax=Lophiotrema nucula TaxID=690887 RepID=A0A6A5ZKF6_9PLEO|nr:hypothetical protein BDV96DRAFT_487682 [Lophiotrema nucula]
MGERHIIPVPAANDDGPVVVVEVKQTGSGPLDVRLVGCEGENPYVANIEHSNIGRLKHKFKGSNHEWEAILSHFLLQKQPERKHASALENVNLVYALKEKSLELSIRQNVQGIKARDPLDRVILGEISLPQDEEFEIDPFEWARISAEAHNSALEEVAKLKAKFESKQETIDKLNAQLEDFIKTKNETETAMLQQFMGLLNEKKRKIRDQQRLLAGAKVDEPRAKAVQASRAETKPRKAGPSRTSKRKAPAKQGVAELESDSDQMEIDESKEEEQQASDSDNAGAATPDRNTDDETEDEDEGPSRTALLINAKSSQAASQKEKVEEARVKPPTRELPFGRPGTRSKPATQSQPPPAPEDDDDETDDDEL